MWVVKLGGSLARAPELPDWLEALVRDGAGRVLVVPGGGPFADAVRHTQAHWRFPDAIAHHMALLAMEQYALMLQGLQPRLIAAITETEVRRAQATGRTPLWMASALALAACKLAPSWSTTSDSLAAWIAARLGATRLVLVKSVPLPGGHTSARALQAGGVVDEGLPPLLARARFQTLILGRADAGAFRRMLRGEPGGTAVSAG